MIEIKTNNLLEIPFIDDKIDNLIKKDLSIENQQWLWLKKNKKPIYNTPRFLTYYKTLGNRFFLPRGYLIDLTKILRSNNIDFQLIRNNIIKPEINVKFTKELRNYQELPVNILSKRNEGVLCAPTGSGKTVIALKMIEIRNQPVIIIVHTKELLYQWIERIKTFLDVEDSDIGIIGDGIFNPQEITISTSQSLIRHLDILDNFGYVICDECHKISSPTFTEILFNYQGKYINGFSATPYRNDGLDKLIEWYAGPILHKIEPQDLIQAGQIVGIEPIIRKTFFKTQLNPVKQYSKVMSELSRDVERNKMIVNDVIEEIRQGSTCLILSDRKSHCKILYDMIPEKFGKAILTGDVGSEERKRIIKNINDGKIRALIATSKLIGEGFDCPNLSAIFLTMPIKYIGNIIQFLGRIMRIKKGKNCGYVYDYLDVNVPVMYGSFNQRVKVYEMLKPKG